MATTKNMKKTLASMVKTLRTAAATVEKQATKFDDAKTVEKLKEALDKAMAAMNLQDVESGVHSLLRSLHGEALARIELRLRAKIADKQARDEKRAAKAKVKMPKPGKKAKAVSTTAPSPMPVLPAASPAAIPVAASKRKR